MRSLCLIASLLLTPTAIHPKDTPPASASSKKEDPPAAKKEDPAAVKKAGEAVKKPDETVKTPNPSATNKAAPLLNKYLVEVYPLPAYCFMKRGQALDYLRPESDAHCDAPAGEQAVQAQNATDVAKALASDSDFYVQPSGASSIVIYGQAKTFSAIASSRLKTLEKNARLLAKPPFEHARVFTVPTGMGTSIVAQITALKIVGVNAEALGNDEVVVQTDHATGPINIDDLAKRIKELQWTRASTPPTQRLFHITSAEVLAGLSPSAAEAASKSGDSGAKSAKTDKTSSTDKSASGDGAAANASSESTSSSPGVQITVNATGTQQQAAKSTADSSTPSPDASPDNKQGSDTTAGKPAANTKTTTDTSNKAADVAKPLTMQAVRDNLVYTNADGTDDHIGERTRLIAMLDLPRPEVLMNMWAFQVSSPSYDVVSRSSETLREAVGHHNDILQLAIDNGWNYLSKASARPGFFDSDFYEYVTQKFALDPTEPYFAGRSGIEDQPDGETTAGTGGTDGEHAGKSTARHPSTIENPPAPSDAVQPNALAPSENAWSPKVFIDHRKSWGWCNVDAYCLGFTHAFEPLRPTFTNILLTIVAASAPEDTAAMTILNMTGLCAPQENAEPLSTCDAANGAPSEHSLAEQSTEFVLCLTDERERLEKMAARVKAAAGASEIVEDCEVRDRLALDGQALERKRETLQLNCFAEQARRSFAGQSPDRSTTLQTTRVGLLRAAVADFLFNYKMAQQYPHDFIPYDLSQSAQELNAEFNPLILAFNRDVSAFTLHLESDISCHRRDLSTRNWIGEDSGTFVNDAIVAVRGISGVESIVDTLSQNFFDATQPPNLTDLVKSVSDAEKNTPAVLKANLTAHEAAVLIGALNSVQPAEAKIGRQLKLDIIPHSLAGASSAELEVNLTNQESADPTLYKASKSSEDNLSRVARHNTTTRVRVESLKLFEVSAFSAMLQRPKSRIPIIPPLFEVPYFGSFIGIPLPGAKEYHRSTAVVSAVIVPTAADLAYGIDFSADRVCFATDSSFGVSYSNAANWPPDHFRCYRTKSFADLEGLPIRSFHKAMIQCFASGGKSRYPGLLGFDRPLRSQLFKLDENNRDGDRHPCATNFHNVPPSE